MAVPPCYPFSARGTCACCRTSSPKNAAMSLAGPTLPTSTVPQVGSYLRYTGRDANVVQTAARDPFETSHDAHLSRFVPGGAYQSTRHALYPFVPSGPDFAASLAFFQE